MILTFIAFSLPGLIAACPTTVIPFFGDQTFWGSAVYRRGVGPRPIPIDSLTTKKLVEALTFMQRPEVKREAEKVSALIQQVSSFSTKTQLREHAANLSDPLHSESNIAVFDDCIVTLWQ